MNTTPPHTYAGVDCHTRDSLWHSLSVLGPSIVSDMTPLLTDRCCHEISK